MYLNIPKNKQADILCVKIQEISASFDYSKKDKIQIIQFYRRKLKLVQPKRNF